MRVEFNRTGAERKALVTAISEILGTKAKYMGMPSTAYDFGGLIVDKTGALEFEENIFPKEIKDFLQSLAEKGFTTENSKDLEQDKDVNKEPEETPHSEDVGFTVSVPLEYVKVGNLTNLLDAKGDLIKKALGTEELPIEITEDAITFLILSSSHLSS